MVSKKVSDSVSKKFGIGNSFGFGFVQLLGILGGVSVSKLLGFEIFPFSRYYWIRYQKNLVSKKVSDLVLKKNGFKKSIGFNIGKIRYRKTVLVSVFSSSDFGYHHTLHYGASP